MGTMTGIPLKSLAYLRMAAGPITVISLGSLFSCCASSANTHIRIRPAPMWLAVVLCIDRPPNCSSQLRQSGYFSLELGHFYKRDRGSSANNYDRIMSVNRTAPGEPGYVVNLCSHNSPQKLKALPNINLSISSHHQRPVIYWSMWILSPIRISMALLFTDDTVKAIGLLEDKNISRSTETSNTEPFSMAIMASIPANSIDIIEKTLDCWCYWS